jgi:hypothetical protein
MKRTRLAVLLTVATSIGFFGGWLIFKNSPPDRDVWLSLDDEVKLFLKAAKENLAKGIDCGAEVGNVAVSASRITPSDHARMSADQVQYFLFLPDWPKPKFPALSGLLTLRKTDAQHADIVFRPGVLQLGLMDIGICVDDYELGAIAWGPGGEARLSDRPPSASDIDTVR